jgi:hypothetical protein
MRLMLHARYVTDYTLKLLLKTVAMTGSDKKITRAGWNASQVAHSGPSFELEGPQRE